MKRLMLGAIFAFGAVASASSADELDDLFSMGGLTGSKLEKAIKEAESSPLGSDKNPVRVNMPAGQQRYLSRLRCGNGQPPEFERGGSTGVGPFGSIVDVYEVDCGKAAPGKVAVYLDMYHAKHKEDRPVPGFTITN